jgi:Zn-finger nucleic acid-binding protein
MAEGLACPDCGPVPTDQTPRQCGGCGTTYFGEFCPGCAVPEENEETAWERERHQDRTTLCVQCGNEIPHGEECDVCAAQQLERESTIRLCPECGKQIAAGAACGACAAKARKRAPAEDRRFSLCLGCGNEVEDIHRCPICADGRSTGKKEKPDPGPLCPRCDDLLEEQEWDVVTVLACETCHGILFPPNGLRQTLTRLREEAEADTAALAEERQKNLRAVLPETVRYKRCPVCKLSMTRRNFAALSGIILDVCGQHGTWVDSAMFEQLAALASKGVEV